MKKIASFIIMSLSVVVLLAGCNKQDVREVPVSETPTESLTENNTMKHEMLTVESIENDELIAVDSAGEKYLVRNYSQFGKEFKPEQKIGVHYKEKVKNADGYYEFTDLGVTKERPVIHMQMEK